MPSVPPAPGRLSNTKLWPICLLTCSNTGRAMVSSALPGGNGTTSLIGARVGQAGVCACAFPAWPAISNAARQAMMRMMLVLGAGPGCEKDAAIGNQPARRVNGPNVSAQTLSRQGSLTRSVCDRHHSADHQTLLDPIHRP